MRILATFVTFVVLALTGGQSLAAGPATVGFLAMDPDPRVEAMLAYTRQQLYPRNDLSFAATLGIEDTAMQADATGWSFTLDKQTAPDVPGLVAKVQEMVGAGQRFIIVDLPGDVLDQVAAATRELPVTLINTSAPQDFLRTRCYPNLVHTGASDRMNADSLVQYLIFKNWLRVLVLVGQTPRDAEIADSFIASAERFRLQVVDRRTFDLSTNPEQREQNNIALLTGGADYDVVYIADSVGEFGRYVPYQTQLPRPVIGSAGLVTSEWQWSFERYGAPQVSSRFEDLANAPMTGEDWSSWMAMKLVVGAYTKARSDDLAEIDTFLRGRRNTLDGSKGIQMNLREWDGQMRMPIMLSTQNAVIAVAPLEGFLHEFNELDTLGTDQPEFQCQ